MASSGITLRTKPPCLVQVRTGFDSRLVPAFRGSWRRCPRPSLVSWLWLMPGWLSQPCALSCSPWTSHQGIAQGYLCSQRPPITWPNTSVGWRTGPGTGIFPGSQPKAGLRATDINHKFNMRPSCRCSADSPSPAVHWSLCKGGWGPRCPSQGRDITAAAVQFFPVCSYSLCFGWAGMRQDKLGPWAEATWLQTGFKSFYSEKFIIFVAVHFLA